MIFSSLEFMFLFLPIVLIVYVLVKPKFANAWLLTASIFFYYKGAKEYLVLLLSVILLSYISGLIIDKTGNEKAKKSVLFLSLAGMIAVMIYYKYCNFLITNINWLLHKELPQKNIILPIGISFFIFQAISYVVDVYRGEKCLKNPIDMGLYISFFPQLIAGPIVRFHDIRQCLKTECRKINISAITDGIWRFSIGICKKVLLANNLGGLVDIVFGVRNISDFSTMYTWLGAIAYTLQIYFDFSGYSDMAIGLGKVFGFEFQENFNYPYIAGSVKEFWKRWHISLSQFFRDYVYIPLGGNRCRKYRWIINMMIVWILTGIWHGASWTYIIWGIAYGIIIIVETLFNSRKEISAAGKLIGHIYTLIIVVMLWVVFRAEHFSTAVLYLKNMCGIGSKSFIDEGFFYQLKNFGFIILLGIIFSTPLFPYLKDKYENNVLYKCITTSALLIGFIASTSYIYMGSYNPFLYFMF